MTPNRGTIIALDFDRTFTSDVDFWRLFVLLAVQRGHTVICVTGRTDSPRGRAEVLATFGQPTFNLLTCCIFCNHSPKRAIAESHGYNVDIWIDDMPEGVGAADPATFKQLEQKFNVCETLPLFGKNAVSPASIWQPPVAQVLTPRGV